MIVVFAPYGRNEVTAAAIRVADHAAATGRPVRFVAAGTPERRVSARWDGKVTSARDKGVYEAARGADTCVWFYPSAAHLKMATTVAAKARQVLVPSWHAVRPGDREAVHKFDLLVCPTADALAAFRREFGKPAGLEARHATFDAGLEPAARERPPGGRLRLLVYCDGASVDECGALTLHKVDQLAGLAKDAAVTVYSSRAWARRERATLAGLVETYGRRLAVEAQGTWESQAEAFSRHDYLILPAVRSDFGLTAARAQACGLPVVAYKVSPFDAVVADGSSGFLVECETGRGWLGAPSAMPASVRFLDRCVDAVAEPSALAALRANDWGLAERAKKFARFWSGVFDGKF